jgi:hypothetical protein
VAAYLQEGEYRASTLEHDVYRIYSDVYALLEARDPRQHKIRALHEQEQYTLLLIDALSLREVPLIQEKLAAHGITSYTMDFALVAPPTETRAFARTHYSTSGPSGIAGRANLPFAFRHVTSETWQLDFAPDRRQRFIWYAFPDDYFGLKDTAYDRHVIQPIAAILDAVLADPTLVRPLVITGDHGYLWQGGQCSWPLADAEAMRMAEAFKHGRSTTEATQALADTGKVWVDGPVGAARGRFGWGSKVPGGSSLFKHGGVSLMECVVPWVRET